MKIACIDTSMLLALAFDEPTSDWVADQLASYDGIFASNLLAAEFAAACGREQVDMTAEWLQALWWILPDRPLEREIARVASTGHVRGADLWHLATALFLLSDRVADDEEERARVVFLTLDETQRAAAEALGFTAPRPPSR